MNIAMIAAVGKNLELGKHNDLIWHLKEDMAFFKATTKGTAVIMGRKTFESLPHALPGRKNIILSSNPEYRAQGGFVVTSIDAALKACGEQPAFIIGGAAVYELFLPLADTLYLTEIEDSCADADTFFPAFDTTAYERTVIEQHCEGAIRFSFVRYTKK